jgi:uncharacterized membrane protein
VTFLLVLRAGLLGIVAGLRSQLPTAALAARDLEPESGPLAFLGSGGGRRASYLAAAGEIVADKLPVTPSRMERGQLIGRVISGGIAGAVLASARGVRGARLVLPVATAAAGAYLGSWGGYTARKAVGTATGLPDPVVAVGEDLVAVGLAAVAVRGA